MISVIKQIFASSERGLKSHAHCRKCQLEWHLTWDGKLYSHPKKLSNEPLTLAQQAKRREWRHKMAEARRYQDSRI